MYIYDIVLQCYCINSGNASIQLHKIKTYNYASVHSETSNAGVAMLIRKQCYEIDRRSQSENLIISNQYKAITRLINATVLKRKLHLESEIIKKANIKHFYQYANSKLQAPHSIKVLKLADGSISTDPLLITSMLNSVFTSSFVYDNHNIQSVRLPLQSSCHISTIYFPVSAVIEQLIKLKSSKTITPDTFSSYTINIFGLSIAKPLSLFFEFMFSRNYIPPEWKLANTNSKHQHHM